MNVGKRSIVGLCGLIGSGKDTTAMALVNQGYVQLSFGKELKRTVAQVFNFDIDLLLGVSDISRNYREQIIPRIGLSPRELLQQTGESMRKIHPKVWVDHVEKEMMDCIDRGHHKFVISDVRHLNEYQFVKNCGGLMVEISDGNKPEWVTLMHEDGMRSDDSYSEKSYKLPDYLKDVHITEWLMQCVDIQDALDFDIVNNGSIMDLGTQIEDLRSILEGKAGGWE